MRVYLAGPCGRGKAPAETGASPTPALPSLAVPRLAEPGLACRALPSLAGPRPACHAPPCRALPCRAMPCLPCLATPRLAVPCRACRAASCLDTPRAGYVSRAVLWIPICASTDDVYSSPIHTVATCDTQNERHIPVATSSDKVIAVDRLRTAEADFWLRGTTGLFCHRMSAKAKHQLLVGGRKKTAAEKQLIKHDPYAEFAASMHLLPGLDTDSQIGFPSTAIKGAMATAALQVAGIRKTEVQRLVFMPQEMVPIFGIPSLRMDIVRSADIARTPDVRTRAYFPEWATRVRIRWAVPALSEATVVALLANAGMIIGIGDYRQEKGRGNYGTFEVVDADACSDLLGHVEDQAVALTRPESANVETAELLAEYEDERARRDQ